MNRSVTCLAALLLSATLVSCGNDDPRPKFAVPETTTATPTDARVTTPTEPLTTEPVALSPEGTVRAWVKARNLLVTSGDPRAVEDLSAPACSSCDDSITPVASVYADGGRYETSGWRVVRAVKDADFNMNHEVVVALVYKAGRTFAETDADPITYEEERHLAIFTLSQPDSRWLLRRIEYLS